jgi:hypothetical protein
MQNMEKSTNLRLFITIIYSPQIFYFYVFFYVLIERSVILKVNNHPDACDILLSGFRHFSYSVLGGNVSLLFEK